MGVYRKNVGLLKATYKSNVKIGSIIIENPGKFLANSYGLDAASLINVKLGELPDAITDFIGGNALVTAMTIPPSVSDVKGIFTLSFPNLEKVYLGNAEGDTTLKDGLDTAYANLTVDVYCDDGLVAGYQAKYVSATNLTFIGVSNLIVYEIPFVGETTLTAEYVAQWASDLGTLASAMEKIIVPSGFTDYEAGALDEIFAQFPNMTDIESPWLNGNTTDGMEWTIPAGGSTTLTAEYVTNALNADNVATSFAKTVIIPSYFVDFDEGYLSSLIGSSVDTLKVYGLASSAKSQAIDKQFGGTNVTQIKKLYDYRNPLPLHDDGMDGTCGPYGGGRSGNTNADEVYFEMVAVVNDRCVLSGGNFKVVSFPRMTSYQNYYGIQGLCERIEMPLCERINGAVESSWSTHIFKLVLGKERCELLSSLLMWTSSNTIKIYVPSTALTWYMTATKWVNYADKMIGYLDYDGTNIPTFSGYTAQWYSDEDCTTSIATSAFVRGNRYFVKLTAI